MTHAEWRKQWELQQAADRQARWEARRAELDRVLDLRFQDALALHHFRCEIAQWIRSRAIGDSPTTKCH
jgi:hypothetical protein